MKLAIGSQGLKCEIYMLHYFLVYVRVVTYMNVIFVNLKATFDS